MLPVEISDLYSFSFYGGLKAKGKNVVFVCARADEEKNDYTYDLMLCRNGQISKLTDRKSVSSFVFENKNTLWFTQPCDEGKKTSLVCLSLKGGEGIEKACLDQKGAGILGFIDEHKAIVTIPAKPEDTHSHAQDYEVLDECPFYFNGQGFISGLRQEYHVYDLETKSLGPSFTKGLRASIPLVAGDKVYFTASADNGLRVQPSCSDGIYEYNPQTGQTTLLCQTHMDVFSLDYTQGRLLLFASNANPIGLNSNPDLYEFDLASNRLEKAASWKECLGNTVGTDCAAVGGNATAMDGDKLCFTSTIVSHNNLFAYDQGKLVQMLEWPGTIHSFGFAKGQLYFIGAKPGELQELYTVENGTVIRLSEFQECLKDKYVAEAKPVFYNGSQQTQQMGWVLYPKDFDPDKKYPAILDIHGGPKTVYGTVFYHEMQLWASHGYFVFFCNPFGSDGQGNAYADLRGKYGTDDYEDLMTFTDAVLAQVPQIDPQRLGVTGGSYGGFMTNWIITHTNRFKAAATQRSISNWLSFWGTSDIGPEFVEDQMAAGLDDPDQLWEHSPMRTIKTAVTPTLIIHSDQDYRCPIEQGYQMLTGLLHNGTEAKMVLFHGENHELSRSGKPVHRQRRLEEITCWMDSHLTAGWTAT